MRIRKHYDSNETDILETYTHRLQDKIHVSYIPGAFGDFIIGGIFLSVGQSEEEILKRAESEILLLMSFTIIIMHLNAIT